MIKVLRIKHDKVNRQLNKRIIEGLISTNLSYLWNFGINQRCQLGWGIVHLTKYYNLIHYASKTIIDIGKSLVKLQLWLPFYIE